MNRSSASWAADRRRRCPTLPAKMTTSASKNSSRLFLITQLVNSFLQNSFVVGHLQSVVTLYRVSDASGELVVEEVGQKPLQQSMMKSQVSFLKFLPINDPLSLCMIEFCTNRQFNNNSFDLTHF